MYPRETILLCQNHKNGVYREPQETGNGLQAKEGAFAPTLLELEQPEQFQFYDLFDVSEFTFSPEKKTGHLKMELSMLQKYRKLSLSAQLLDTEKEVVLKEIPIKCAADESRLTVEQDFALDEEILPENLGVLVHGAWEADGLEENKMKILRKADLQAKDYIYKHTHPASQETTCIIGSIEGLDPYIPVTWEKGESGHIVIALIRKPEDLKDVDYLCGAGRVPQKANRPVLCVPGAGELDFPAGYQPESDSSHLNTAECRLYKKSGGCAVIASTAAYEIEGKSDSDGAIKLTRTGNGYRYQFTAWNNGKNPISYDDADQWRKTEFDYELKLTVYSTTQEGAGKRWHRHTLRVASFEKADYTIPSLQIMYGCVAADTNIRMADGSEKEIRFVKIGDTVLGRDGIEMKVENVWSGPEQEPMREFMLEGEQRTLSATQAHPMWIAAENGSFGWKRAGDCQAGEFVFLEGKGACRIQEIREKDASELVYNLDLQPVGASDGKEGSMYCNGILTGDNRMQNGIREESDGDSL